MPTMARRTNLLVVAAAVSMLGTAAARADRRDDFLAGRTRNCVHCDLSGANFKRHDLAGVDLTGANLTGTNFHDAKLAGARFTGANLSGANLNKADLSRADLSRANLHEAMLYAADLDGAKLAGAKSRRRHDGNGAIGTRRSQWRNAPQR